MAWISALVFCAFLACIVESKTFRWCAISDNEMKKCNAFVKVIPTLANNTKVTGLETPACVKGENAEDCIKEIKANDADFITLDGGRVYTAGKDYGLVPIVAELTGTSLGYYGVAVAKKDTNISLTSLKGRKTCHTGYGRTAGWNIPVGWLLANQDGFRQGCGDNIDAQSASKYFKESCAAGAPSGYDNLCALCPNKNCKSFDNEYAGYDGAFKCMKDGKGEVAFVKHLTTAQNVGQDTSGYKYLCTNGSSVEVTPTSHLSCNFAQTVSHTVMTRSGGNTDFIKILLEAGKVCNGSKLCENFDIFNSVLYGGTDLLFKDKATSLVDVGDKKTYQTWLGEYAKYVEAVRKKGDPCTTTGPTSNSSGTTSPNNGPTSPTGAGLMSVAFQPLVIILLLLVKYLL